MRRSAVFLLEMVLSVLIFAVCAVICISLLVHSHRMANSSGFLNEAVFIAQSSAARFQAGEPVAPEQDGFSVRLDVQPDGRLEHGIISVTRGDELIYTLAVAALREGAE
jgi:hypothetical protein